MDESVDEVLRIADIEGIEADVCRGGLLRVARNDAQEARLEAFLREEASWGESGYRRLTADDVRARIGVAGARSGVFNPHAARVQPARLVMGLAAAVERLGVTIAEETRALSVAPRCVRTDRGDVRATFVIRATEGFTARLPGLRRTWLPLNSSMIVTEPLPAAAFDRVGWGGGEVLGDFAHNYFYAQITGDGRIAIGGRGRPYRYGSRFESDGQTSTSTVSELQGILVSLFPALDDLRIDQAWSGVLGVPRDWCATVGLDETTGLGWAGGYVGHGIATTNLAGRTLVDLITRRSTPLTTLPWVDRRSRRWEPEPARWLGVFATYAAYRRADRRESRGVASTSRWARAADALSGRQ
jgi:glycine/D-amino acid oxidase-like deaminating enzyme